MVTAHRELGEWQACAEAAGHALGLLESQNAKAKSGNPFKRQKCSLESALALARTRLDTASAVATPGDAENNAPVIGDAQEDGAGKAPAKALQSQLRNLAALMERNRHP